MGKLSQDLFERRFNVKIVFWQLALILSLYIGYSFFVRGRKGLV